MNLIYYFFILIIVSSLTISNLTNRFLPGPTGSIGPMGPAGPKGYEGSVGATGDRGPTGFNGIQGSNDGLKGPKGPTGPKGARGPQGIKGFTGPQGLKGYDGLRGVRGKRGDIGLPGLIGSRGDPGEYIYTKIDLDSCKEYSFDNENLELKCPFGSFLTKIDLENKKCRCCKLMLDERCNNNLAKLTEDDNTEKSTKYYRDLKNIFYMGDYVCDDNYHPSIEGDANNIRCCKKEEDNNTYLKLNIV